MSLNSSNNYLNNRLNNYSNKYSNSFSNLSYNVFENNNYTPLSYRSMIQFSQKIINNDWIETKEELQRSWDKLKEEEKKIVPISAATAAEQIKNDKEKLSKI